MSSTEVIEALDDDSDLKSLESEKEESNDGELNFEDKSSANSNSEKTESIASSNPVWGAGNVRMPWKIKNCGGRYCHGTPSCPVVTDERQGECGFCDPKQVEHNYFLLFRLGKLIEKDGFHLKGAKPEVWKPFVAKIFQEDPIFSKYPPIMVQALYRNYDIARTDFLKRKGYPKFHSNSYTPGMIPPISDEPETPYDRLYRKLCYELDQKELKNRQLKELRKEKTKKYKIQDNSKEILQSLLGGSRVTEPSSTTITTTNGTSNSPQNEQTTSEEANGSSVTVEESNANLLSPNSLSSASSDQTNPTKKRKFEETTTVIPSSTPTNCNSNNNNNLQGTIDSKEEAQKKMMKSVSFAAPPPPLLLPPLPSSSSSSVSSLPVGSLSVGSSMGPPSTTTAPLPSIIPHLTAHPLTPAYAAPPLASSSSLASCSPTIDLTQPSLPNSFSAGGNNLAALQQAEQQKRQQQVNEMIRLGINLVKKRAIEKLRDDYFEKDLEHSRLKILKKIKKLEVKLEKQKCKYRSLLLLEKYPVDYDEQLKSFVLTKKK